MTSFFALNMGGGDEGQEHEDELALGMPDQSEVVDHALHVSRCALRYRLLRRTQVATQTGVNQLKLMLYVLIAIVVLTSPTAEGMIVKAVKLLGG